MQRYKDIQFGIHLPNFWLHSITSFSSSNSPMTKARCCSIFDLVNQYMIYHGKIYIIKLYELLDMIIARAGRSMSAPTPADSLHAGPVFSFQPSCNHVKSTGT